MAATEEIEKEILAEMAANPVPYAAGQVNDVITIDGETRMISVPASEIFFGVESDKDVERKHFRCPKVVGDGIDLSKHQIYISYITSDSAGKTFSGNAGLYLCEDVATDGDDITFSWQLSGNVFASAGFIAFKVLAAKTDGENVQTRWNTVPAIGTVLMTVPDGMDIGEAYPDIVTQLLERMASVEKIATEEAMQGYVNTYLEAHPGEIDETLTDPKKAAPASVVGELKEDLIDKTKNLKHWNLIDISKVKEGYGYTDSIGYPPTLITSSEYNAIDEVIPCKAGETYTVNWLYGAIGIYDSDIKRIQHLYIDSIPKTFVVPDGGCYMTLFGGPKRMVDIMLVEGNEIPDEYIPHSIFDIESKKDREQDKTVESILHPLKGVKWCAYGDSLTDSATLASQTTSTKNYVDYVSESLGLKVVNCGVGGTGYMKTENRFVNRVSTIPEDTELLTVFGSFNDYEYIESSLGVFGDSGINTIYGCMKSFFDSVFSRCPDIVVGVILPTKWGYLSPQKDSEASEKCDLYINALKEIAAYYDLPVLDLYNYSNLRPWDAIFAERYYKDDDGNGEANTIHPLDSAHKKFIAPKVEAFIKQIYHVY